MQNIDMYRKEYLDNSEKFDSLANSVSKILYEKIKIPVHSVKYRIKDFDSFYNKIQRKGYSEPFLQCTDIIGFRVICLFKNQVDTIVNLLKRNFVVDEIIDKEKQVDEFSYKSIHVIVHLKSARPKALCDIPCEIQIRTILQEAWAEIEHYFNYKQIGVDQETLRKVNALSALFEIADDQFQTIYDSFENISKTPMKKHDLNPELLYHYCKQTFPWAWKKAQLFDVENIGQYNKLLKLCKEKGIFTVKQLDDLYHEKQKELDEYDKKHVKDVMNSPAQWPSLYQKVKVSGHFFSPTLLLSVMVKELYER